MTTLVKTTPFVEMDSMERWINSVLSNIGFGPLIRPFNTTGFAPAADVYIAEGKYVIELEVPGFAEEELAIEITGRLVTITGTHTEEVVTPKTFRLHERLENEFQRTFMLPPDVEVEKVTSIFANGVLKVFAPLPAAAKPLTIPIKTV